MKCKKFERKILDFIEGNVNIVEKEEIEKHLSGCKYCKSLYSDFLYILENSKKIKIPQINENLWKMKIGFVIEKGEKIIKSLKPLYISISIFILFLSTIIFTKIHILQPKKQFSISEITGKIEFFNHELPFSEDEIIKYADYMEKEEVEKVLDFIFAGL